MQTNIREIALQAMKECIATRGQHKGQFLKKAPPSNTLAYAAWQGAMMAVNPYKVSIGGVMFMTLKQREVMAFVQKVYESTPGATMLDRDREALDAWGVW